MPKNKIPAFKAKAGEKPMVSSFSNQILNKAQLPSLTAFPAFPAGVDTVYLKYLNKINSFPQKLIIKAI